MKDTVGVAELRQNLSRYLQRVKRGERLLVTERNRPVATLSPAQPGEGSLARLIAEGAARPAVRRGPLPSPVKLDLGDPHALSKALEQARREST